jgi:hypothetical protein
VGGAGFGDLVEWQRLQRFQVVDEMKEVSAGGVSQSMLYGPVSIPHDWSFSDGSG